MNKMIYERFFLFIILILLFYLYFVFYNNTIYGYFYTFSLTSILLLLTMLLVIKGTIELKLILWITTIIFVIKIITIGILPVGSDDYYCYLLDGKVLLNCINQFQYAPDSETLNHLHSNLLPLDVTYPHIKTIYFPLSQAAFDIA